MPSADALRTAAEWLDCYEGHGPDDENTRECHAVAEWLRKQAENLELNKAVRRVAKERGVTTQAVRAYIKQTKKFMPR